MVSLTVREAEEMVKAARRYGRVFQVGTQGRASARVRFACEVVRSGRIGELKTVYVAGGAVVRGIIGPDEPFRISSDSGLRTYISMFVLRGNGITFRGRGIIDGSRCTTHARHLLVVQGSDIQIEGVILRDSSTWNMPIQQSDRVTVQNVKILGYRANSDGIDICNSRDVTIEG